MSIKRIKGKIKIIAQTLDDINSKKDIAQTVSKLEDLNLSQYLVNVSPLSRIYNHAKSLLEVDDINPYLDDFKNESYSELKTIYKNIDENANKSVLSANRTAPNPIDNPIEEEDIKQFSKYKAVLTKAAKACQGNWFTASVPIIPQFAYVLQPSDLSKAGIDWSNIGHYYVWKDQIILGVSMAYAKENKTTTLNLVNEAIISLEARGVKLSLLSEDAIATVAAKGFSLYWVMQTPQYNRLLKKIPMNGGLDDWGLAFK